MYIKRHIEKVVERQSRNFPVIVLTGARQVGKSTMFQHKYGNINHVSLNTPTIRKAAIDVPSLFFENYPPPVIVDEVQRAPTLFEYLKDIVDNDKKKGQFFLTGSQSFELMQNVSESLAGRAGIIKLMGLSYREINGIECFLPFKPEKKHILWMKNNGAKFEYQKIIHTIWQGSFPALYQKKHSNEEWMDFYNSYLQTYIERDVKQITQVQDEDTFMKFISSTASLTGQMLNYSTLADICGKDITTVKRWMSILQTSGLVYLLQPYSNNLNKRLIKTPKLFFLDTGLACFLLGWNTEQQLINGASWGHIFETFCFCEILKSYYNYGTIPRNLFYYRDKDNVEIDLVIEEGDTLYPVEMKTSGDPVKSMAASFRAINNIPGKKKGEGAVICLCKEALPLTEDVWMLPVNLI
jgi:predicted AAA+ superfamily ATPase